MKKKTCFASMWCFDTGNWHYLDCWCSKMIQLATTRDLVIFHRPLLALAKKWCLCVQLHFTLCSRDFFVKELWRGLIKTNCPLIALLLYLVFSLYENTGDSSLDEALFPMNWLKNHVTAYIFLSSPPPLLSLVRKNMNN